MADSIEVLVAAGLPERQQELSLQVAGGTTARAAVAQSGLTELFPEIPIEECPLAVFGKRVADDYQLRAGDRVEVCRPLKADPRDARRALALQGRSMGAGPADAD